MLVPLLILAALSVCGGWVGIHHKFDDFLSPVFHSHTIVESALASDKEAAEILAMERLETVFTGISVAAGLLGLYFAWLLYVRHPQLPRQIAQGLGGFYEAVVHKYYVDELYAALFVKPLIAGSTRILWQGVDRDVIDATLDNSADGAREASDALRQMQSGNLRSYAGWIAAGAAAVIAYMIWMGSQ
jgi:NADH-quinone oxidoreductase subunit L